MGDSSLRYPASGIAGAFNLSQAVESVRLHPGLVQWAKSRPLVVSGIEWKGRSTPLTASLGAAAIWTIDFAAVEDGASAVFVIQIREFEKGLQMPNEFVPSVPGNEYNATLPELVVDARIIDARQALAAVSSEMNRSRYPEHVTFAFHDVPDSRQVGWDWMVAHGCLPGAPAALFSITEGESGITRYLKVRAQDSSADPGCQTGPLPPL